MTPKLIVIRDAKDEPLLIDANNIIAMETRDEGLYITMVKDSHVITAQSKSTFIFVLKSIDAAYAKDNQDVITSV